MISSTFVIKRIEQARLAEIMEGLPTTDIKGYPIEWFVTEQTEGGDLLILSVKRSDLDALKNYPD